MLYFFLSYARGDDDIFVKRFYQDLCKEVRVHAGADRDEEVGFLDNVNIEPGQHWPQALVAALSECAAFLALYSPAYFLSRPCGKEWTMFAGRSSPDPRADAPELTGLIPLIWLPPRALPDVARTLQYDLDVPDEVYSRSGLRQLLRLQRHQDTYLEFVSVVAQRVIAAASAPPPRANGPIDFDQLESAFHRQPESADPADGDMAAMLPSGQIIHFVIVAPSRTEAETIGRNTQYYGDRAEDWAPFRPVQGRPLQEYAQKVASDLRFQSTVTSIDHLKSRIQLAQQHNHIVVLLVDAWCAELRRHRQTLEEIDQLREQVSAVLIVMSHSDHETQRRSAELADRMRRTLLNNEQRLGEVLLRRSVLTGPSFDADLQVVLAEASNRLMSNGRVFRYPPNDPGSTRPILEGP